MPTCIVKKCTNYIKKHNKIKDGISYHRFPTNLTRKEAWCRVIRVQRDEPDFMWKKDYRVCSAHFSSEDYYTTKPGSQQRLKNTAIPRIAAPIHQSVDSVQNDETQNSRQKTPDPEPMDVDISDLQSIFDTPRKVHLKRKITKLEARYKVNVKKIKNLRKQNTRLKKNNESLLNIIKEVRNKRFINSEIEAALGVTPELAEIYRLQMLNNRRSKSKSSSTRKRPLYPPALRKFAMALNFYSPAAYKYVRRMFNCCLPHPRTLSKWYSSIDGEPGYTKESFEMLKLKRESMNENIEGCVMFDEMSIRQAKLWKGRRNLGHVDMGNGNVNKEKMATKAFVLMLVCLKENWKIPLGYCLVDNFPSSQIASILSICLEKLHHVGTNVHALVCDGCPSNISALNILGTNISSVGELKTSFPHPITKSAVTVFLDACHMIKLVRNIFESKRVIFNGQGQSIEWKFLTRLLKLQTNKKLSFGNKLTARHIYFKNQIMKVRLAVQLLSKSVADALRLCDRELNSSYFANSAATVEFIEILNIIFDILNSRRFNQSGFKSAICKTNKTKIFDFIDKAIDYIKSLKVYSKVKRTIKRKNRQPRIIVTITKKPILASQSKTGFLGLIVCMESLKTLYRKLVETDSKLSYISTYRLSQDHLELFFSLIRRHGGFNDNPNAVQYKGAYRRALNHLSLKSSFTGNCIPLDNFPILTISSEQAINSTARTFRDTAESNLSSEESMEIDDEDEEIYSNNCDVFSQNLDTDSTANIDVDIELIVGYIAGWVARALSKKLKCETCVNYLFSAERLSFHKLIELKNMGSLCFPSVDLFEVCLKTEKNLRRLKREFMDERTYRHFITQTLQCMEGKDVFSILDSHSMEQPATLNHRLHLLRLSIEKYTNVRKHYESKMESMAKITKRQKFKKLVLFEGQ